MFNMFTIFTFNDKMNEEWGCSLVIVTMEHVAILDKSEALAEMILQSEVMQRYEDAYITLYSDPTATALIRSFTSIKDQYEDVERFGRYHPDYAKIMREVRSIKREMDLNPLVAEFKLRERELQRFLDDISEVIAKSVSEHIIVPRDDALYSSGGCASGKCASGQACSCSA